MSRYHIPGTAGSEGRNEGPWDVLLTRRQQVLGTALPPDPPSGKIPAIPPGRGGRSLAVALNAGSPGREPGPAPPEPG